MKRFSLALAMMLLAFNSHAANKADSERGWYLGGSVGSTTFDDAYNSSTIDDSDTSTAIFGGYRFNRYFAVQGNIVDLGTYADSLSGIDSTELSAVVVTAVGLVPMANTGLEAFGRIGLGALNYTQKVDFFGTTLENSSSGSTLATSLGLNYSLPFLKRLTFHVSYDYYYFETKQVYGSDVTSSNSVSGMNVGARFNF